MLFALGCTPDPPTRFGGTLEIGGNTIPYEVTGEGEPLVLIHGRGVDRNMWRAQVERFAEEFQVIAYDLRGHGESEFTRNLTPDAEDLTALLDELAIDRAHVFGLSLGAMVALDFALAHPERVASLGLLSPALAGVQDRDPGFLEVIAEIGRALDAEDLETALTVIERMTFEGRRARRVPGLDSARAYVERSVREHIAKGYHTRIPPLVVPEPATRLGEIETPTLILHGQEDLPYIDNNVRVLAEGIGGATVVSVPDAGHMLNVERADQVNAAIAAFLARLATG